MSLTGASNCSPNEVSPSGPPDALPHNQVDIETAAPDPYETEDFHTGIDPYNFGHADNSEDTQPPSLDMPDRPPHDPDFSYPSSYDIPSGDIEDLWLLETIHLNDLRTSADFIHAL